MPKVSLIAAVMALLALSSCANTVKGMAQDAKNTGQAMDSSTKRVLRASSN